MITLSKMLYIYVINDRAEFLYECKSGVFIKAVQAATFCVGNLYKVCKWEKTNRMKEEKV